MASIWKLSWVDGLLLEEEVTLEDDLEEEDLEGVETEELWDEEVNPDILSFRLFN